MTVNTVTADQLLYAGFQKPQDLQFLSTSVQVSIQGANAFYIRGSGTNSTNNSTEQSAWVWFSTAC